jgi:hypothetical protein
VRGAARKGGPYRNVRRDKPAGGKG